MDFWVSSGFLLVIALNRVDHARVRAAPAHNPLETLFDFGARGVRVIPDERITVHDGAGDAVAALQRLKFDKRLLDGMQATRIGKFVEGPETFKRSDAVPVGVGNRRN